MKKACDTIISGAGIYGMLIAKNLSRIYPEMKIVIIEEKNELFNNNSTFNSGVLHSGIYYKPNSLKSKFCRQGNLEMKQYIKDNKLFLMECGKLIVANSIEESYKIDELYKNGQENGIDIQIVDPVRVKTIDRHVNTRFNSLFLPSACIGSPSQVIKNLYEKIKERPNIKFVLNSRIANLMNRKEVVDNNDKNKNVMLKLNNNDEYECNLFINCSGSSSDSIAHLFNQAKDFTSIHLKAYYDYVQTSDIPKTLIYPVPSPFSLGLHITMQDYNTIKFGPSVDFNIKSIYEAGGLKNAFMQNLSTFNKYIRSFKINYYKQLIDELLNNRKESGIQRFTQIYDKYAYGDIIRNKYKTQVLVRSPVINLKTGVFESDFVIENSKNHYHLINFQSPAWTCSFALTKHITSLIEKNYNK